MNRDAKRISSNFKADISRIKSFILATNGRGFYGDRYPLRKAVKELREAGYKIVYKRDTCSYYLQGRQYKK